MRGAMEKGVGNGDLRMIDVEKMRIGSRMTQFLNVTV